MHLNRNFFLAFAISCAILSAFADGLPKGEAALSILVESDRARGGLAKGLSWEIDVTSVDGEAKSERTFEVKAKNNDASVESIAPSRTKGEIFLFNDRTMWFFKPGLRKPVAISARQRLSGQAANGDIASTNYARDYSGAIVRMDKIGTESTYVFELKAKSPSQTYDRIRYWISVSKKQGIKAEFLTLQGEVFKSAFFSYGNEIQVGGRRIPFISQMKIIDSKSPGNWSLITYRHPVEKSHPDSLFNVNNLAR